MKNFKLIILSFILILCFTVFIAHNNSKTIPTNSLLDFISNTSSEKIAYLTFDDGPSKKVTPQILDILNKYNIEATFFVIGKKVDEHPEILKRIYSEGHLIGNHTYNHNNTKLYSSKDNFITEIKNTENAISNTLEIDEYTCNIFRFPNGYTSPIYLNEKKNCIKYLNELGYMYIDWNALNKDAEKKYSNEDLLKNLKNTCKGKSTLIILMHDSGDVNPTHEVLEDSIKYLIEEGYEFKTLDELVNSSTKAKEQISNHY